MHGEGDLIDCWNFVEICNAWRFVTLWKCHLKVCHFVEMPPKGLSFCENAAWRFAILWKCRLKVCHFVEMPPGGFVTSLKSRLRVLSFCGNAAWRFITSLKSHLRVMSFCGNDTWRLCHFIEKSLAGFVILWKWLLEVLSLHWKVTCGCCYFVKMMPRGFVASLKSLLRVLSLRGHVAWGFCLLRKCHLEVLSLNCSRLLGSRECRLVFPVIISVLLNRSILKYSYKSAMPLTYVLVWLSSCLVDAQKYTVQCTVYSKWRVCDR